MLISSCKKANTNANIIKTCECLRMRIRIFFTSLISMGDLSRYLEIVITYMYKNPSKLKPLNIYLKKILDKILLFHI